MTQLDNKKMWESLIRDKGGLDNIIVNDILNALIEQGLNINENGEIVSTEPNFKIEKGKRYVCTKESVGYTVGNIYKATADGFLESDSKVSNSYNCSQIAEHFRPVTDEDEAQSSQRMESAEAKEELLWSDMSEEDKVDFFSKEPFKLKSENE